MAETCPGAEAKFCSVVGNKIGVYRPIIAYLVTEAVGRLFFLVLLSH